MCRMNVGGTRHGLDAGLGQRHRVEAGLVAGDDVDLGLARGQGELKLEEETGFWVAITMKGSGSVRVAPSIETVCSSIDSSNAD